MSLQRLSLRTALTVMGAIGAPALAKIPTNTSPTQGDSDNILEVVLNYAYDILLYGGTVFLAFCAIYFLGHVWDIYNQTREGKKTKKDLLTDTVIGAVLLLISVWGLNYGLDVLSGV
ncbi:TIGR03745 family integrating conjugative element membrane protein [Vibrio sp. 10N.261.46.A3]|uniref:TIGR03745 family integrating conjugative element membrane protein n=1 Tax=Vibrio sp. 10N.261.46.A3 TaxID=3229658 RepID=UPI00354FAF75